MIRRAILAAVAAAVISAPAQASTVRAEVDTVVGPLQIVEADILDNRVVLNGKEISRDETSMSVWNAGSYPADAPKLVLLQHNTGGTGCPAVYSIVDASSATVTETFGTCSDIATAEFDGSALKVSMPDMNTGEEKVWTFENGVLTESE